MSTKRRSSARERVKVVPEEKIVTGKEREFGATWKVADLDRLKSILVKNGFNGDYKELRKEFPHLSEQTVRGLFNQLSRSKDQTVAPPQPQ